MIDQLFANPAFCTALLVVSHISVALVFLVMGAALKR